MPVDAGETIAECLTQARSDPEEAQCRALQALSSLTKVSSHNRNLLAHSQEAIPTILALSKSPCTTTHTLSLSILFNLSLNPNLKHSLANMHLIHHLNSLILSPSSPQTGKLAASLLCSLTMHDKNKARFGVAGTVEAITKALANTDQQCSSAHHLLSSLAELLQYHGNCTLAVWAGAVPMLARIAEGPSQDIGGTSLAILALLARFEEGIGAIRSVEGVVGLLVDGLRGCMVSRESAAEVLIRLFEESEEYVREAARKAEFSSLLADLSIRGSAKAREKAGILMKTMMEANLDCYVEGTPLVLR